MIYNKGLYNRQRITEQVCILHDHCNSVKSEQALKGWCFPEWECARRTGEGKFTIEDLPAALMEGLTLTERLFTFLRPHLHIHLCPSDIFLEGLTPFTHLAKFVKSVNVTPIHFLYCLFSFSIVFLSFIISP